MLRSLRASGAMTAMALTTIPEVELMIGVSSAPANSMAPIWQAAACLTAARKPDAADLFPKQIDQQI